MVIFLLSMDLRVRKNSPKVIQTQLGQIKDMIVLKERFQQKILRFSSIFHHLDVQSIQEIWAVHGEYSKSRLDELVPFISEWKLIKLYLWSNKNSRILQNISSISFPNLKELHLGWNNIQSIQGLCNLNLECLTDLVLRDNKINSVQSLRKCNLPKLKILCLRGNKINQIQFAQWNFKNLVDLNLNNNSIFNVSSMFLLSLTQLKSIRAKPKDKIQNSTYYLELQAKLKFIKNKRVHF